MAETQAVHLIVHGMVQGVGFRYFTQSNATKLGVSGWVRNKYDGTVEIWGEGVPERLEQFVHVVRRGPLHGYVETLDIAWQTVSEGHHGFHIRY